MCGLRFFLQETKRKRMISTSIGHLFSTHSYLIYRWHTVQSDQRSTYGILRDTLYGHIQIPYFHIWLRTTLQTRVLAGDYRSLARSKVISCSCSAGWSCSTFMLEILPLSLDFEFNMTGTKNDNRRKTTPSLKYGETSKL